MSSMSLHVRIKFGPPVWHDQPFDSPQLNQKNERDFYDRTDALNKAMPILLEPNLRTPIVLIGERRAGKTSLLRLLLFKLGQDQRFIPTLIPWLGIDSASKLMQEFLDTLFLNLGLDDSFLKEQIGRVNNLSDFQASLEEILADRPGAIVVFGIDEFDSIVIDQISDPMSREEIFRLITFLSESTTLPIKLILTSVREPEQFGANYMFKTKTEPIHLTPFSFADLRDMISETLKDDLQFTDQELNGVYQMSGGWPYFAKALILALLQLAPDERSVDQAVGLATKNTGVSSTWEHIYQIHWDEYERSVILFISNFGGHVPNEKIRLHNHKFKIAVHQLIDRGYLEHDDKGYYFKVGLLQVWLSQWLELDVQKLQYRNSLSVLSVERDPWDGPSDEIIEVSKEDLVRRGF
jgi:hypothetical protein